MATFKQYSLKNGEKKWMFHTYLGINPETGKEDRATHRGFRTQREAKNAEAKLQIDYQSNLLNRDKPKTYQEVYDLWLTEYEKTVRASTLMKTKGIFRTHILNELGDVYIKEITPIKMQELMNIWAKKYTAAPKMMNYAGLVFKYAIRFGLIDKNPTDSIRKSKPKKSEKKDEDSFYDKQQLKFFLKVLDNHPNMKAQTFFRVLAMTGMRKQEIGALTWKDINFKNKTINIDKAITRTEKGLEIGEPKNNGSKRIISVDSITLEKLNEWKKYKNPPTDEWLIFGKENATKPNDIMSLDTSRKWLLSVQEKMEEMKNNSDGSEKDLPKSLPRISVHGLRHTHVSLLIEIEDVTIKDIQYRLGHTDIQTTMNIYAHVSKLAKEKLADKFNKFIDF